MRATWEQRVQRYMEWRGLDRDTAEMLADEEDRRDGVEKEQ